MNRFRKLTTAARLSLAALTVLAFAPGAASARNCDGEQIQCIIEYGSGSFCIHEYVRCLMGQIIAY